MMCRVVSPRSQFFCQSGRRPGTTLHLLAGIRREGEFIHLAKKIRLRVIIKIRVVPHYVEQIGNRRRQLGGQLEFRINFDVQYAHINQVTVFASTCAEKNVQNLLNLLIESWVCSVWFKNLKLMKLNLKLDLKMEPHLFSDSLWMEPHLFSDSLWMETHLFG
jgi:hypothetical protein